MRDAYSRFQLLKSYSISEEQALEMLDCGRMRMRKLKRLLVDDLLSTQL